MYAVIKNQRHQKMILLIAAFAIFMDGLDGSIVNVALPVIAGDFGVDISGSSWVVMAYLLIMAGFILAFGKIADQGRIRQVFSVGFAVFALGSFLCVVSPTLSYMIAARALQGLGASMIAAAAPLLVTRFLPEGMRGLGMGVIATTGGVALTFGPPIGGLITAYLGWHWIFLINVPIGIAAIILGRSAIPVPASPVKLERFDFFGTFVLFFAIAGFIMMLERGPEFGWTSPEIQFFAGMFAVCAVIFCLHSLRSRNPLLNIRIFRHWKFSAVTMSYLLTCMVFAGVMYMVPFYMHTALGLDAAVSGLLLMISSVITALTGIPVGAWCDRIGCRTPCMLAAVCRIAFCAALLLIVPSFGIIALIPALVCMGLAFGISGGPATTRIVQHAPEGEAGTGTSVMITSDFLGGVLGVAAYAVVFSLAVPASIGVAVSDLSVSLFVEGFHATAALGLLCGIVTLILSAAVPNLVTKREDLVVSE
ncbi:MAG: MFS transporter [Methanocorpusculum sp.]|nr:MFS transporter [Methanocorpusculum sp.]MDE2524149.1 MFS transporter [Methanocorpusculum sp.]